MRARMCVINNENKVITHYSRRTPTVMQIDNHWGLTFAVISGK